MAERTKFSSYLIYSVAITPVIYPVFGHWAWGSLFGLSKGWLEARSFIDFAGVDGRASLGGWLALAGAIVLGPRMGKYGPDGKSRPIFGHNIPLAALGVFILWFGWFGFNPGSTNVAGGSDRLHRGDDEPGGGGRRRRGHVHGLGAVQEAGRLDDAQRRAGGPGGHHRRLLHRLDPRRASSSALVAGILVVLAVVFIDKVLKIDDPVGAVSVHGVCGAFGTIMAGVFNSPSAPGYVAGATVGIQFLGVGAMFVWAFGLGMVLFMILKKTIGLRVTGTKSCAAWTSASTDGGLQRLPDLHDHLSRPLCPWFAA